MNYYRERIKNAPSVFSIPKQMRNRDVEIIILPMDEIPDNGELAEIDENGYPVGFFEETAGSLPDFPERELQPVQPDREDV